jgi:hypothetical protein
MGMVGSNRDGWVINKDGWKEDEIVDFGLEVVGRRMRLLTLAWVSKS